MDHFLTIRFINLLVLDQDARLISVCIVSLPSSFGDYAMEQYFSVFLLTIVDALHEK